MIWPLRLAVFYPYPAAGVPWWEIAFALTLLGTMSVLAVVLRCDRPYFFTGWLWYLGMLVPVVGIIQVGSQGHADRYTYLPQIGLYLLATWLFVDLTSTWPRRREILGVAAALILAGLVLRAWIQTSYWRNSESLWTHTLSITSENYIAHNNLGLALAQSDQIQNAIALVRNDNSDIVEKLS